MIPQDDDLQKLAAAQVRLAEAQARLQDRLGDWRVAERAVYERIEAEELPTSFAFRLDDDRIATVAASGGHLSVNVFNLV